MANDREVLKVVWEGKIPCKFVTESSQEEYFMALSRISYLPMYLNSVKQHFQNQIENDEIWFSYNGVPLKWNYPVGLLFDLLVTDDALPWQITINTKNYPDDILIRCPSNKDVVESSFMSLLKEADALKHKGQIISQMQKKDHKQLLLGILNDKFDQFWAVNRRLMESVDQEGFKYIPLRCYSDDGSGSYVQKLITPLEKGQKKTLQDLLVEFATVNDRKVVGAKTHGVEIPLNTELQWLSEMMSYPDNFLHLCLIYE